MIGGRRSLFYKVLLAFILVGVLPAMLIGARMVSLSYETLSANAAGWALPEAAVKGVSDVLKREAISYLIYTLLVVSLVAVFASGSLIGPLRKLQKAVEDFRREKVTPSVDIHTGDEIEALGNAFQQLTRELLQIQHSLEETIALRTQAMEKQVVHLQTAAQIAREAASVREMEELLNQAVNLIRQRFDYYFVNILLVDDQGEYAVLRAATGEAGRIFLQREYKLMVGGVGLVGYVTSTGEPRVVNDVDIDFVYRKDPLLPNTRAEVGLPLKVAGKTIGVLDIQSDISNAFTKADIDALQILADQLAIAIENVRLLETVQHRLKEVNILYKRYIEQSWARTTLGGKSTGYQYDLAKVMPAERQIKPHLLKQIQAAHHPTLITSGESDVGFITSTLVAPLMMYDQMIGVIGLEEENPDHRWTDEEIALVEAVASQVTLALDNARLLEETQFRSEQFLLLQGVTAISASHIHLIDLVEDISRKLLDGFNLLHCGITLIDPDGKNATIVADVSRAVQVEGQPGADLRGQKINLDENTLAQEVIQNRRSVAVYDVQSNPLTLPLQDVLRQRGTQTLIVSPLLSRDEVIGTIWMDFEDSQRVFTEDDLRLMDQISLQIAVGIEVARNFELTESRAERERMISEITARMRETLDVDTVMQTTVDTIYRSLGLEEVALVLSPDLEETA